jgi:hypothetical protein
MRTTRHVRVTLTNSTATSRPWALRKMSTPRAGTIGSFLESARDSALVKDPLGPVDLETLERTEQSREMGHYLEAVAPGILYGLFQRFLSSNPTGRVRNMLQLFIRVVLTIVYDPFCRCLTSGMEWCASGSLFGWFRLGSARTATYSSISWQIWTQRPRIMASQFFLQNTPPS